MNDLLPRWVERVRSSLTAKGMVVTLVDGAEAGNCSVDIDCAEFVGTICYWPEHLFEFGFNDCKSGKEIVLETRSLQTIDELDAYFDELLRTKLSNR